jgi:hypothetical protein
MFNDTVIAKLAGGVDTEPAARVDVTAERLIRLSGQHAVHDHQSFGTRNVTDADNRVAVFVTLSVA